MSTFPTVQQISEKSSNFKRNPLDQWACIKTKDFSMHILQRFNTNSPCWPTEGCLVWKWPQCELCFKYRYITDKRLQEISLMGLHVFFHIHIYRCGLSPCPHTVSGGCPKTSDGVATVKGSRMMSSSGPDAATLPWVWREGLWIGGSGRVWLKCPGTNWSLVDCHQVLSSGQFDRKSRSILTAGDWYFSH